MLFNSFEFILIFLPILCVMIGLFQNNNKIALSLLLLGSFSFYAYHSLSNLFLMLSLILFNFLIGQSVQQNKKLLWFGVTFNIAVIAYFKYSYFIFENVTSLVPFAMNFEKIAFIDHQVLENT